MALALAWTPLVGCSGEQDEPPGSTFGGEVAAIEPQLAACSEMRGTPAGRWCEAVRESLSECEYFLSICPRGEDCTITSALACVDRNAMERAAESTAGGWFFQYRSEPGWWAELRGHRGAEGVDLVEVEVHHPERAAWARWLPSAEPPDMSRLALGDALLHLRYRPAGGLGIASGIGTQSFADRLFSLKSDLFTAAVLGGDVELAIYLPDDRQQMPPAALAVDFRLRQPAIAAMEGFIEDLRERYPLSRVDFALEGFTGACLTNLRVMPDLSPCYVATDEALVVGWNPASLQHAIASSAATDHDRRHRLDLFFERFPVADERLAAARGRPAAQPSAYPWKSMRVIGERKTDSVLFEINLVPGGLD